MNVLESFDAEDLLANPSNLANDSENPYTENWVEQPLEATEAAESENIENISYLSFDPKLIKITVETATIYGLVRRLQLKQIDLYPKFQRKANLWDDVRKSRLIESLLLRFPLPAFYFDIEGEFHWLVVDGLQRLSTLYHFIVEINAPLKLTGLEILTEWEGKSFKQLPITLRQRILDTNLTIFQIQAGTPKAVKYNLFKRINTGGLGLTPMEIRYALNQSGAATYFFETLTGTKDSFFNLFIKINKIPIARMEDRELALRYVAFSLNGYRTYQTGLGKFLDKAMEQLDGLTTDECDKLLLNLEKSIQCYEGIFGNTRFGRGITNKALMNSALFEAWTSELARLTDEQRNTLLLKKKEIIEPYVMLLSDKPFLKSIISNTATLTAVKKRFFHIQLLIKSVT